MTNIFKATKDEILKGCQYHWCFENELCEDCKLKLQLLEELNKKVEDVLEMIDNEICYEMTDTDEEKVSEETKSVLKVLRFKLKSKLERT